MQKQQLTTCHPQTDAQAVSEQRLFGKSSILSVETYGVDYAFGQMGSVFTAVSPPSFLPPQPTHGREAREEGKT